MLRFGLAILGFAVSLGCANMPHSGTIDVPPPFESNLDDEPQPAAAERVARVPSRPFVPVPDTRRGKVRVHISTVHALTLERRATVGWEFVCAAPCDADLPVRDEYRLADDGTKGPAFKLRGRPTSRVVIEADVPPGS